MPAPPAAPPKPTSISQALDGSDALASLKRRLAESNARYAAVQPVLPQALAPHVRPGPLDDNGWSLLAANPAVAAKLRQLVPTIEEALLSKGWQATPIRVRIQPA